MNIGGHIDGTTGTASQQLYLRRRADGPWPHGPEVSTKPSRQAFPCLLSLAPPTGGPRPEITVWISSLGFFLVTLDILIVSLALPSARTELGGGIAGQQWVMGSYTLMFASLLLFSGNLSDRMGKKCAWVGFIGLPPGINGLRSGANDRGPHCWPRRPGGRSLRHSASVAVLDAKGLSGSSPPNKRPRALGCRRHSRRSSRPPPGRYTRDLELAACFRDQYSRLHHGSHAPHLRTYLAPATGTFRLGRTDHGNHLPDLLDVRPDHWQFRWLRFSSLHERVSSPPQAPQVFC